MAVSARHKGWRYDVQNKYLSNYVDGTEVTRLLTTSIADTVAASEKKTLTTKTSATDYTMTAAELLGGLLRDTTSGATAAKLPLVTDLVALTGSAAGSSFYFTYLNPGNSTVTITTHTGWTLHGTMAITTAKAQTFLCIIDSATAASLYSMMGILVQ
jgi:hypothetical protein